MREIKGVENVDVLILMELTAKRLRMYAPAPTPMPITLLTLQRNRWLPWDWRGTVNSCIH